MYCILESLSLPEKKKNLRWEFLTSWSVVICKNMHTVFIEINVSLALVYLAWERKLDVLKKFAHHPDPGDLALI